METTTVTTVRIVRSENGIITEEVSKHGSNKKSPSPSTQVSNDAKVALPYMLSYANMSAQSRTENRIKVPLQGELGNLSINARPLTRGRVTATQNYSSLASNIRQSQTLFEDPDFPADISSLFYSRQNHNQIRWMRPQEICNDPKFIVEEATRFDVCQGELGDCWLLSAVASLAMYQNLFQQVVPSNQSFKPDMYNGAFHFNFWFYGEWKEVIVDDRLPTKNNTLLYLHSEKLNEFWSALLEKAYAKLCGCYELLKGGYAAEAMEDFTGGITEIIYIENEYRNNAGQEKKLFSIIQRGLMKESMFSCNINPNPNVIEAKLANGLIMGHAYSITSIKEINANVPGYPKSIKLIRVRNPWGEVEWNGDWSDTSRTWSYISGQERETLNLQIENDGEFWMSFNDFIFNFSKMDVCHLGPQSLEAVTDGNNTPGQWKATSYCGTWKRGVSAGGCQNYPDTFWTNPQFYIDVCDSDDNDNLGTVIIGLLQKNTRSLQNKGANLCVIGFTIYQVPQGQTEPLNKTFFNRSSIIAMSPTFINTREITGRFQLPVGSYVVVPSTFEPNKEAEFLLRVFSEKAHRGVELDHATITRQTNIETSSAKVSETEDNILRTVFTIIVGDDMEVDVTKLRDLLNASFRRDSFFMGFSVDTCRSIVVMMDAHSSGSLCFEHFQEMWQCLKLWKRSFEKFDKDDSGTLNSFELRGLLNDIGFTVSNRTFSKLVMRFSSKARMLEFDDFIHCCVRLNTAFTIFDGQKHADGYARFDRDTFIDASMYA